MQGSRERNSFVSLSQVCSKESSSNFADQDKFRHQYFNERKC